LERQNLGEKFTVKGVILLILLISFLIGLFLLIINIGENKTSPTNEQVHTALENQGFFPSDFTEEYIEEYPDRKIVSVIGHRKGEMRIEFFELEDSKSARTIYSIIDQIIIDARGNDRRADRRTSMQSYAIHTYYVDDKNYWLARIDNTVIYGFCYDDDYEKLLTVMTELGYTD
jgi:hypothetical protein